MDITIQEDGNSKLVFEISGETHGFCNLLKTTALRENDVSLATYSLKHPLIAKPQFTVEGKRLKDALKHAANEAAKTFSKLEKDASKIK